MRDDPSKKASSGSARPLRSAKQVFSGKHVRSGNSSALRLEKTLFRMHPEFIGNVRAEVIAPGAMLVVVDQPDNAAVSARTEHEDPVLDAFLAFLAQDIASNGRLRALDEQTWKRRRNLVGTEPVPDDHDFGDEPIY